MFFEKCDAVSPFFFPKRAHLSVRLPIPSNHRVLRKIQPMLFFSVALGSRIRVFTKQKSLQMRDSLQYWCTRSYVGCDGSQYNPELYWQLYFDPQEYNFVTVFLRAEKRNTTRPAMIFNDRYRRYLVNRLCPQELALTVTIAINFHITVEHLYQYLLSSE